MQNLDPHNNNFQTGEARLSNDGRLDFVIDAASDQLLAMHAGDGHWSFALEADVTIPSEYIMLNHFLGEPPGI